MSNRQMTTTKRWTRMNAFSCMLCKKAIQNRTKLWHTQQRNACNSERIMTMKLLSQRNRTSDNCEIRSSKSTILHDDQEVKHKTSTISRNISRLQLHNSTLQRKRQCMNRCTKLMIRSDWIKRRHRTIIIINSKRKSITI